MRDGQQIDLFGQHVTEKLDSREAVSARRPGHGPHLGPAGAGERADRPLHGCALRSDRAGGDRLADRLLGVALGAADGDLHPHHAGADLRHDLRAGHRHPAGFGGVADHRAGPAGGRSGGGGRLHQAHAGRRTAANRRALAGADEDRHRHHVRDHHQHRRLSAVPDDHRKHRRVPLQPADRDDLRAGGVAAGVDDVHSAAGLLHPASRQEAREAPIEERRTHRASPGSMRGWPSSPSSIAGRSPSARWPSCCWAGFSSRS